MCLLCVFFFWYVQHLYLQISLLRVRLYCIRQCVLGGHPGTFKRVFKIFDSGRPDQDPPHPTQTPRVSRIPAISTKVSKMAPRTIVFSLVGLSKFIQVSNVQRSSKRFLTWFKKVLLRLESRKNQQIIWFRVGWSLPKINFVLAGPFRKKIGVFYT